jgi:hypothetical protein
MAKVKWNKLEEGDFFIVKSFDDHYNHLLYQKTKQGEIMHTAVLLNTGEICNLYIGDNQTFEKVEVTFDIKPTE